DGAGPSESVRDAVAARRSRGRDHVWARGLAAAAIAAALFLGGWFARGATSSVPAGSAARVVAFRGPVGELQVAYRPGTAGAYLFGSRLPAPGPGRVLEVWMIRGESVTSGACVTPSRDG